MGLEVLASMPQSKALLSAKPFIFLSKFSMPSFKATFKLLGKSSFKLAILYFPYIFGSKVPRFCGFLLFL